MPKDAVYVNIERALSTIQDLYLIFPDKEMIHRRLCPRCPLHERLIHGGPKNRTVFESL